MQLMQEHQLRRGGLVYNNQNIVSSSIFLRWWLQSPHNHFAGSRQEDGHQHGKTGNCKMVKEYERGADNYFPIIYNNKFALLRFISNVMEWICWRIWRFTLNVARRNPLGPWPWLRKFSPSTSKRMMCQSFASVSTWSAFLPYNWLNFPSMTCQSCKHYTHASR